MRTKWRTRHSKATRLAVITAACAVALPTAAVAQGGAAGGQNGVDGQSTKASATGEGIPFPELDWSAPLGAYQQVGGDEYELVFDSEGHALYQGVNRAPDPDVQTLVAVDRETGNIDWELAGVSAGCGVVASDDGMIYGMTATDGIASLMVIDAAAGTAQVVDPAEGSGPEVAECYESLRLAPDGTLIVLHGRGGSHMDAFDTTDGLRHEWRVPYIGSHNRLAASDRPVISADGTAIYQCRRVPEADLPGAEDHLLFEKLDLATGTVIDDIKVHEHVNPPTCDTKGLIAIDGGAVVVAEGAERRMLRIDASGANLSIDWQVTYSRDEAIDESGLVGYPAAALSLSGDTIVFRIAGTGRYAGVDVATGEVLWQYSAGLTNTYEHLPVDRHGNLYVSNHDAELESFDGDGNPRFQITREDLLGEDVQFGAKMVAVGPDGGIFLRGRNGDNYSTLVRVGTGPAQRVAGGTRYDTAAQIATANFSPGVDTVFLAVGTNFPDALTGGPLAAHLDAPVLLTDTNALPSETSSALDTLRPANVIALGGTTAVSDQVLTDAGEAADGAHTDRYAGGTRYETAAVIADKLPASDTVYLAVGTNYPDTLAGGPATDGAPILLTGTNSLPSETAQVLAARQPANVIALGGPVAVSNDVLAAAAQAAGGADTDRLSGGTRYGTGVAIAQSVVDAGDFSGTVYVAVGTNYPDAVSAASAAQADGAPIVLTGSDELPAEVADWLAALDGLDHVVILGGTTAISDGVADALAALAR